MLRFSSGVMRMDRIGEKPIKGTAQVRRFGGKVRDARLRWFGHTQRKRVNKLVEGCSKWSYQKGGKEEDLRGELWMWREDMQIISVRKDVWDRERWRKLNLLWHLIEKR